jgi:ATP-dependent Clp protease ATP-binding subunit ClpC
MALANQIAIGHHEALIDTEHVLLGLVQEGTGVGAHALMLALGENHLCRLRVEVEKLMPAGGNSTRAGKLPLSSAMKRVVHLAILEARLLKHNYVGTEHILP